MSFDFLLDQNTNDLVLRNGDLVFTETRQESLSQRLGIVLRTFKEEWFINTNYGVPYKQSIIGIAKSKTEVDAILLSIINRELDAGQTLRSFNSVFDRVTRYYHLEVTVTTPDGLISIAFNLNPYNEFNYPSVSESSGGACTSGVDVPAVNDLYEHINFELALQDYTWQNTWV